LLPSGFAQGYGGQGLRLQLITGHLELEPNAASGECAELDAASVWLWV